MIYLTILVFLFFLILHFDVGEKKKNRDLWYFIMFLVFTLVAGLRYRLGGDTVAYWHRFYDIYPQLKDFSFSDYPIGTDPLFVLFNSIVKACSGGFWVVQLLHALFINALIFKYFKRHSSYLFSCLLFYFIGFYFTYNMEIMRASISIVLCLYAFDFFIEKKWIKGLILWGISCFFHAQSLVVIIFVPLFLLIGFNKRTLIIFIIAYILGFSVGGFLDNNLTLLEGTVSAKASYYESNDAFTSGASLIFLLIYVLPTALYILLGYRYLRKRNKLGGISHLEGLILMGLLLLVMESQVGILNRYTDYFRIYFAMFYAELFVSIIKAHKNNIKNSLATATIVFAPMFCLFLFFNSPSGYGRRYYPYSSVIEKSIDQGREELYNKTMELSSPGGKY